MLLDIFLLHYIDNTPQFPKKSSSICYILDSAERSEEASGFTMVFILKIFFILYTKFLSEGMF